MSILLSVNPPFAEWLADGEKTIEWRKKPLPVGKAYIYETKKNGGCGMVIGEVYIMQSTKEDVGDLFGKMYDQFSTVPDIVNFLKEEKISKEDLVKYGNGNSVYACECCEAFKYEMPLPLSEFIHPSDGCCNEGKCRGCKWLEIGNECIGLEDDCWADFDTDCFSPVRRPPQSWCYVEDLKGETK